MSKNKTILIILICVITIILHCLIACICFNIYSDNFDIEYIYTEADAIEIGKIILKNRFPEFDYTNVTWHCFEFDGTWLVSCSPPNSEGILGGGNPQVCFEKNAHIVFIGLSK